MVSIITSSRYKLDRKLVRHIAQDMLVNHGYGANYSLNIIFAGRTKLRELAKKYKKEDEALPVLTFIYNEDSDEKKYLGEIFICYPQAVIMAAQKNKKVDDMIVFLVKHGVDNILKNI